MHAVPDSTIHPSSYRATYQCAIVAYHLQSLLVTRRKECCRCASKAPGRVTDDVAAGVVEQGRTVVTTIHQPNSSITRCFDDLLLLAHGNIIYMGKWAKSVEYFQAVGYQ